MSRCEGRLHFTSLSVRARWRSMALIRRCCSIMAARLWWYSCSTSQYDSRDRSSPHGGRGCNVLSAVAAVAVVVLVGLLSVVRHVAEGWWVVAVTLWGWSATPFVRWGVVSVSGGRHVAGLGVVGVVLDWGEVMLIPPPRGDPPPPLTTGGERGGVGRGVSWRKYWQVGERLISASLMYFVGGSTTMGWGLPGNRENVGEKGPVASILLLLLPPLLRWLPVESLRELLGASLRPPLVADVLWTSAVLLLPRKLLADVLRIRSVDGAFP